MGTSGIYSGPAVDRRFTGHRIASVEGPTAEGPGSFQEYAANHRLVLTSPKLLDAIEAALAAQTDGRPIDVNRLREVYREAAGVPWSGVPLHRERSDPPRLGVPVALNPSADSASCRNAADGQPLEGELLALTTQEATRQLGRVFGWSDRRPVPSAATSSRDPVTDIEQEEAKERRS
jgi:hypothetical protein